METVTLSVNTINNILNYLGSKPYVEVAHLIAGVQQEIANRAQVTKPETKEASESFYLPEQSLEA